MQGLFASLSKAVEGAPVIAFAAAFAWGVLSILLSPCHLATIPLIVGFVSEQRLAAKRRAFLISLLFASGILITIGIIGLVTAALGRVLGDIGVYGAVMGAIVLLLVGLYLVDVLPAPWSAPGHVPMARKGIIAAFLLGLFYGIALGPCTFAYMAPILAVTLGLGASSPVYGALLLLMYGLGHCSVIVAAGTSTEMVQSYLNWNEQSRGTVILKRICGALVLAGSVYVFYLAV